jgi:ribose-phosphate pyrophosphokinase
VEKRDCLVISEILDSGNNLSEISEVLREQDCGNIYYYATHGLITGDCIKNIKKAKLKEVIITNTLPEPNPD